MNGESFHKPSTGAAGLFTLAGTQIPGGCGDCDAYQTIVRDGGVILLNVHHDDTCPWYCGIVGGGGK